ncbi:MAG TPA: hypothetical protein VMZ50_12460, partial [Phycisphaerae bacterium]|nr:hypothetical protein [Phycisphaerae bacterium]
VDYIRLQRPDQNWAPGPAMGINTFAFVGDLVLNNESATPATAVASVESVYITGSGQITWNGALKVLAPQDFDPLYLAKPATYGDLKDYEITQIDRLQGATTVIGTGAKLVVDTNAPVYIGGIVDMFTDTANSSKHADVQNDGTITFTLGDKVTGAYTGTGTTVIQGSAALNVTSIVQDTLTIEAGGALVIRGASKTTSVINNLSIDAENAVNVIDTMQNLLKVDYSGDGNTVMPTILSWIESGAIISTDSDVRKDLGYFDDATNEQVRVMFTWKGDIDCDDDVDLDDLTVMGTFYNIITDGTAKWYHGDVNKDGNVDLDDLTLLGTYYNLVPGVPEGGAAPIPEPGAACLLAAGALGLLRRRRG